MTLPVSSATTEISFSTMKFIKSKLRNKMRPGFLEDSMTIAPIKATKRIIEMSSNGRKKSVDDNLYGNGN